MSQTNGNGNGVENPPGKPGGVTPKNGSEKRARVRFGEAALKAGFIEKGSLDKALAVQRQRDSKGESHKLLGIILLEMGAISNEQLIGVLKEMNGTTASGRIRSVS